MALDKELRGSIGTNLAYFTFQQYQLVKDGACSGLTGLLGPQLMQAESLKQIAYHRLELIKAVGTTEGFRDILHTIDLLEAFIAEHSEEASV